MRKTHDYRLTFSDGIHSIPGECRIVVYAPTPDDRHCRPVIVAEEPPENSGPSITNAAEVLAAWTIAKHFPALLDTDAVTGQPVIWLERYAPQRPGKQEDFDQVTFTPWRVRVERRLGQAVRTLGTPDWRRLTPAEVVALLGAARLREDFNYPAALMAGEGAHAS